MDALRDLPTDRPGAQHEPPPASDRFAAHGTVLVVDDEEGIRSYLRRILSEVGYHVCEAGDGPAALDAIARLPPDIVLLDVRMPGGLDGFEVCRRVRADPETRLTPVVIVTALNEREERIFGIEAGADDLLTKPIDSRELLARVRSLVRIKQYTDDLDSATAIIMSLAAMIEARDGYSEGHCHRMANYATSLGRELGLGEGELLLLHRGGFLHDIGMLAIEESLLQKVGALRPDEYERIKQHTIIGDRVCSNLRSLQAVRPLVRHHHERLDGSGYPDRLRGDQVPALAQIIGIVDVFEALTTPSPYQGVKSAQEACHILERHVRCGWRDRDLVTAFVSVVDRMHPA